MGEFKTTDGVRLRYHERGHGPVVLACQGGPANISDTLARSLEPLEDAFRLVYHDYRGSGRSGTAPSATYTFERLADDLDELRAHLGLERARVLAHSMDGFVALTWALRHPGRADALVLVGTTPTGRPARLAGPALRSLGPARIAKVIGRAAWYGLAWSWRHETRSRRMARYAIMATTQEGVGEARRRVRAAFPELPAPNDNVTALEPLFSGTDLTADLARLHCPVLVLYGERDAVMVAGGHLLVAGLPRARCVVLPRVGHEPFVEAPELAFPPVRQFLSRPE